MAILNILHYPDPRLRKQAEPVSNVDDTVRQTVRDMFETMYEASGIGLAATQVNIQQEIIVIDLSEKHNEPLCLINPKILQRDGVEESEEGCLSVPGYYEKVQRAERIKIRAINEKATTYELETDGLLAVCIQHEMDHLRGKLFVDYLSPLKQKRVRKKMLKQDRLNRA